MTMPVRHYSEIDWALGLCRTGKFKPDVWFDDETIDQATTICQRCPIRAECLQWALDTRQSHGVWGGLSADQRTVTGWTKNRIRCPGCRSKNVSQFKIGIETCLSCGLSWKV